MELYEGSKVNLEDMTGNVYDAMKNDDDDLLRVEVSIYDTGIALFQNIRQELKKEAEKVGADALVNVTYLPGPTQGVSCGPCRREMYASGYAVKKIF